jgi:GNAT superfamily N-acetyltransferase
LGDWTRDLLSGRHPTTSATEFTVVEEITSGKIVSSQVLIPQTWFYEDIPFGVGRLELVGTDKAYRRRGLIRLQMEIAHALSSQREHLVQAITGIPWFYRQFDYEMALDLGGSREFFWDRPGNDKLVEKETYQIRPAVIDDVPLLNDLYKEHASGSLIIRARTDEIWRYELAGAHPKTVAHLEAFLISNNSGKPRAYVVFSQRGKAYRVTELGVLPGHSWRSAALFVTRELKRRADEANRKREKAISHIVFQFADTHPAIKALGIQLEKRRNDYSWFIRVPDLARFIEHIKPVLDRRLAGSVMAGHSGTLRLNFYTDTLKLTFENGELTEIGRYRPATVEDGDALFPDLTFLQMLFGHRSYDELDRAFPDLFANAEGIVLLEALFPKRPSYIRGLN